MKKLFLVLLTIAVIIAMTACGQSDVDKEKAEQISGSYKIMSDSEDNNYWALFIGDDDAGLYLTIYDDAAGNPGVEGVVTYLDDTKITVAVRDDLYEELPSDKWECDGKTLEMTYEKTPYGITLTNNNASVNFGSELSLATKYPADDSEGLTSIEYDGGMLFMEGSVFYENGEWTEGSFQCSVPEGFEFTDWALGHEEMSADEFIEFIKTDEAKGLVIEMSLVGNELDTCGVCQENASMLCEDCGD